jgi:hypothetical protein
MLAIAADESVDRHLHLKNEFSHCVPPDNGPVHGEAAGLSSNSPLETVLVAPALTVASLAGSGHVLAPVHTNSSTPRARRIPAGDRALQMETLTLAVYDCNSKAI